MKLKQLLAAALMFCSAGAWAQTDVTSTYLTNADFSSSTPINSNLKGYGKDGTPYGFQAVDGWTSVVTNADNSNASFPNSGMGGAVFAYGTGYQMQGNNKTAPAKGPNDEAGQGLGFFAVWGCGGYYYQEVKLAAGKYTLTFPVYNQSGTQANTTYTGFFPTSGTNRTVAINTTVGSWVNQTVTFTLTAETEGQIRIGYQSTGNGSGANPHLFFDGVKIEWTDPDAAAHAAALDAAKYTLNGYIKKATALNGVLSNSTLATAIETAQGVYDVADDWADDYDNTVSASNTLNTAITNALSGATSVALNNGNFDTTPNNTLNGDGTTTFGGSLSTTTSNPDNTKDMSANTGDHGYLYDVTGWTQYSKFNSTAAQGTTSEYGTAMPANGWSTNSTTPPATDMFGTSTGAALHLSAGWNDQGRYLQTIENLPAGRYVLYYEVINQHNNTGIASNYIGVSGTAGDFYGTTNSFVYSDLKTIEQGVWKAQAFEFDVAKAANINFSVGVTTSTAGSGNGAKLWIDNYLVYRLGDVIVTEADANTIITNVEALDDVVYNATIKSALATAKSTFIGNKTLDNYNALNEALIAANESKDVYTTLDAAITKVEGWTATTVADGIRAKYNSGTYTNETAADIYAEYQAAEIAALAAADATDYTSAIINPSFETGDMTGWSAENRNDTGVKENSNGTYTTSGVDGDYLFNSWGGTAENNVYQTIKNLPAGTYQLSALLAGFTGEELIIAANDVTNSVIVAGDKTTGNTVNVVFTLDAAADVVIKASNTKATNADASFIKADNFRIVAYSDPLAAYKEQLTALQSEATTDLANEDYANVTGEEKTTLTTLSTLVPEETEEAYTAAISDITAAISAFTGAKASYDALVAANAAVAAVPVLIYADSSKKPVVVTATTAEEAATKAAAQTTAIRAYYESHALAEGVEGAANCAEAIEGADPEVNTGWTGGIGVDNRDLEKYTDASGNLSGKYYDGGWSTSAGANINMSRSIEIPAGTYLLTVTARGSNNLTNYKLSVGGEEVNLPQNGSDANQGVFGHGWDDASVEFESDGTPVTLTITASSTEYQQWVSFNRFRLIRLRLNTSIYADATDYEALNSAIAAAEAKTLGFEDGEFAPYNNIAALKALAAAKAIDQTAELTNYKTYVEAVTTTLTDAKWTANSGEVSAIDLFAIYDATNVDSSNRLFAPGWGKAGGTDAYNTRLVQGSSGNAGMAAVDNELALFTKFGTTYGEDAFYTMPLKANTVYKLSFKFGAWGENKEIVSNLTITDGNDNSVTITPASFTRANNSGLANESTDAWFDYAGYFKTNEAGDYVLTLSKNNNGEQRQIVMGNIELIKAVVEAVTISETSDYTPTETIANVTLARTIKADTWNTFVVPFDIANDELKAAFGDDVAVSEFSDEGESENAVTVNFNTMETPAITANKPVLLKGNAGTSFTFNGKLIKTGEAKVTGTYVDFVGTYAASTTVKAGDYFISGDKLYKSVGSTTVKGTRAYIDARNTSAGVKLFIDDLETAISEINGEAAEQGAIYNIAGQRVNKAQKGIYIVNGKKVVVK